MDNAEYPFIAIAPGFILTGSGSTNLALFDI